MNRFYMWITRPLRKKMFMRLAAKRTRLMKIVVQNLEYLDGLQLCGAYQKVVANSLVDTAGGKTISGKWPPATAFSEDVMWSYNMRSPLKRPKEELEVIANKLQGVIQEMNACLSESDRVLKSTKSIQTRIETIDYKLHRFGRRKFALLLSA